LRIGFHAYLLNSGDSYRNAGISQYIRQLLTAMQAEITGHDVTAFVNGGFSERDLFPNTRIVQASGFGDKPLDRILFEQYTLPIAARRLKLDVLHGTAFALPLMLPCAGVVSIHDVSFRWFRDAHHSSNRRYLSAISRLSVRRAKRIIAVSQATADDCVSLLGADRERVRVVYCGVDPFYHPRPAADVAAFRAVKGLTDPYILFVGTLEPRKNLGNLLKAFAQARKRGLKHRLVVVGGAGWMYEDMLRRVREDGLDDGVAFAGFAPAEEMPLWYGAADAFVYPSLLEGFGLPVAEAMACGTPVITSNTSSMPEVGGAAAAYATPTSVDEIADRLLEVANNVDCRAAMSAAGLKQAARFSWDKAARETMAVYAEATQ
jgi:glycosyltransferase involved in cell wall biosynthesis